MNRFKHTQEQIVSICEGLQQSGALPAATLSKIVAEPPKQASHGDIATNAAMVIGGQAKANPREIAAVIAAELKKLPDVQQVDIAGPGFINITFTPAYWQAILPVILEAGRQYGASDIGAGQKVNVEYISVNPTGPMHIGHARHLYGDALATLLAKAGYDVTREYYINDAGAQIDKLADSLHLRYREAHGEVIGEIAEGLYPGDYLIAPAQQLKDQLGDEYLNVSREKWLEPVRRFATEAMLELIKSDLAMVGVVHDVFTSERSIVGAGKTEAALAKLTEKGLIYQGVLEAPKGKTLEDWEPTEQTLFKSTDYGDDQDRALKKSDGSWTYLAPDMAYHHDKIQRGFTRLIDVLGADHGGYVSRITAAVRALGEDTATLEVKLCQMVKFMRGGEPIKMSKRAGTFISLREVVEEVGKDALRFMMVARKNDAPLEFDFDMVKSQSKDNPVFYVQYAHARAHSVLRHAKEEMPEALDSLSLWERAGVRASKPSLSLREPSPPPTTMSALIPQGEGSLAFLAAPEELALIKQMAAWPRVVESAAIAAEPHRVAFYVQELAAQFHALWNKGNDDADLRFLQKDALDKTAARLVMLRAFTHVIASGLEVLGVTPLEEMR